MIFITTENCKVRVPGREKQKKKGNSRVRQTDWENDIILIQKFWNIGI